MKASAKICAGVATCCCLLNLAVLVAVPMFFLGVVKDLQDNFRDLMWIDDTTETDFKGPLGEIVSEKKQYENWKRTPAQLLQDCLELDSFKASDCKNYASYAVSIFNVTNPDQVVAGTAKPRLEQLGPIQFKAFRTKQDVQEAQWNAEGIANFTENFTFELDEACGDECQKLLDQEVIVPNPLWAAVSHSGFQPMVLFTTIAVGIKLQVPEAFYDFVGSTSFGLTPGAESTAFADAFVRPGVLMITQNVSAFLASFAQMTSAPGPAPLCMLGTYAVTDVAKCAAVYDGFMTLVADQWSAIEDAYGSQYATVGSMPVFVRATVREVLGLDGATFFEPLMGVPQAWNLAVGRSMPALRQMARKFGAHGVDYAIGESCLLDPDCGSTCVASDTCTPSPKQGFTDKFPARLWGAEGGFEEYAQAGTEASYYSGFTGSVFGMRSEGLFTRTRTDGDGEFSYVRWKLSSLPKRLENCAADANAGTQGYDCASPLGAQAAFLDLGGGMNLPLYSTATFFATDYMDKGDFDALSAGQSTIPYDPAEKVTMVKCSGNKWCDEGAMRRYFYAEHEPETGTILEVSTHTQLNVRLGSGPAPMLHQNLSDVLMPVATLEVRFVATPKLQDLVGSLQTIPGPLHLYMHLGIFVGGLGVLLSLACGAWTLYQVLRSESSASEAYDESTTSEHPRILGRFFSAAPNKEQTDQSVLPKV